MNVHPDHDSKRRAIIAALRAAKVEWLPSHVYWRMSPVDRRSWLLNAVGTRA